MCAACGRGIRSCSICSTPDSVAKLFLAPERETLIQEQRLTRNIDSKNPFPPFDYCAPVACRRVCNSIAPKAVIISPLLE